MANQQTLVNYQEDGITLTLEDSSTLLNAARNATPERYHHLYRAVIRFEHDLDANPGYYWGWILK